MKKLLAVALAACFAALVALPSVAASPPQLDQSVTMLDSEKNTGMSADGGLTGAAPAEYVGVSVSLSPNVNVPRYVIAGKEGRKERSKRTGKGSSDTASDTGARSSA